MFAMQSQICNCMYGYIHAKKYLFIVICSAYKLFLFLIQHGGKPFISCYYVLIVVAFDKMLNYCVSIRQLENAMFESLSSCSTY